MVKQNSGSSQPPSNVTAGIRPGSNAAQAAQYMRFALSQLGGRNGHHEFEQLCFQLARRRVYPNVLPATGPVSAGGDQGADFETFHVGEVMPVGTRSPFFARVSREKVVFACSLEKNIQKKVKEDLEAAAKFPAKVERLYFFSDGDVAVGRRHKLQEFAQTTYGIALEIFDGRAISELLVDPEVFWIAQQYLSIPSDFVLAVPKSSHKWYEEVVNTGIDGTQTAETDFYRLKDAVRFATHDPVYRSDLPGLLTKLRVFREHRSVQIQRRAFYEEFVAALRGLEDVRRLEEELGRYISAVAGSDDPSELEDGAILVSYAIGTESRGLLTTPLSVLAGWRQLLLGRVLELLREPGIGPGRKCALLSTNGFLLLFDWIDDSVAGRNVLPNAAKAVAVWRKMIKEIRSAPLFPLERFGKLLSQLAGGVATGEEYSRLVSETDKLLATRFGRHKLAEQAFERAQSYYAAGKTLEAIDEFHKARVGAFTEERAGDSVQFCIFLTKMYSEVGLHFAAKWYGLGAAFAALKVDDDSLRSQAYRGLSEAASSDHASGASMEFFLTARAFLFVAQEYSMAGSARTRQFEWARIDFYSLVLTRAASYLNEPLFRYLKDGVLKSFGGDEIYDAAAARLDELFGSGGYAGVAEKATKEGILPPFSDAGPRRRVGWEQLGIRWFVDWENNYQTAQAAEGFCATLQILLEDLKNTEMSLLRADVFLKIELHDGGLEIRNDSDNKKVSLVVLLPRTPDAKSGLPERAAIVQGVAASALKTLSAMPREQFLKVYEQRVKAGLLDKLFPYAVYDRLFREFYSDADFSEHYSHSREVAVALPKAVARTAPGLAGPAGLHPAYSKSASERTIGRRYERLAGQVRITLPRLAQNADFLDVLRELRRLEWKDWHILQAIASLRLNFVIDATVPRGSDLRRLQEASHVLANRDEEVGDPAPPSELLTVEELKRALVMTQLSTLKGLGFECAQRTPNFEGLDRLLRRFNYWTDDVPHSEILPK
jgi:hypothetical protein